MKTKAKANTKMKTTSSISSSTPGITTDAVDTSTDSRSRLSSPTRCVDETRRIRQGVSMETSSSFHTDIFEESIDASEFNLDDPYSEKELQHVDVNGADDFDIYQDQDQSTVDFVGLRSLDFRQPFVNEHQMSIESMIADASLPNPISINPWMCGALLDGGRTSGMPRDVFEDPDPPLAFSDGTIDPQLLAPLPPPPPPKSPSVILSEDEPLKQVSVSPSDLGTSANADSQVPTIRIRPIGVHGSTSTSVSKAPRKLSRPLEFHTAKSNGRPTDLRTSRSSRQSREAANISDLSEFFETEKEQDDSDTEYRPNRALKPAKPKIRPKLKHASHALKSQNVQSDSKMTIHQLAAAPTMCHQCRRKSHHEKMRCTSKKSDGNLCGLRYCIICICKRYVAFLLSMMILF